MNADSRTDDGPLLESLRDFPDWLSPMLVKEFRQGLRAGSFLVLLLALHIGVVLVEAFGLAACVRRESTNFVEGFFWGALYGLVLLGAPLRGLAGLHSERESRTLELLVAAGVSGTRLAWGKWVSLMIQSLLMVLSLIPYFVLRYYTGGVDLAMDARLLVLALLASGMFVAVAIAASGVQRTGLRILTGVALSIGFLMYWLASFAVVSDPAAVATLNSLGRAWILILAGALLTVLVFLRLAGDAVGPCSENGAWFPRVLLLPGWALALSPWMRGVGEPVYHVFLWVMGFLSLAVFAWHLDATRVFDAHVRPFLRSGVLGRIAGVFLLPNWVGCLWILPLGLGVLTTVVGSDFSKTVLWMVGAFLASGVFLIRIFFPGSRNPIALFALYGSLGGLMSAVSAALQTGWKSEWFALFPAYGIWNFIALQQQHLARDSPVRALWKQAAATSFWIYFAACVVLALGWMRREIAPRWKKR